MNYIFIGRLGNKFNHNYLKFGSKAFFMNQVWLSKNKDKNSCKLNLLYFKAFLVSLVYLTYRHLFGLKRYLRNSDDVAYWYNSTQAIDYIKLYEQLKKRCINPVQFLSMRFSSFRYQRDIYHRVYDYRVKDIFSPNYLNKYYDYISKRHNLYGYYFLGNPVLDFISLFFKTDYTCDKHSVFSTLRQMRWQWLDYLMTRRKWLSGSKLEFKGHFHHYPDDVEELCRRQPFSCFYLLGLPEEYLSFPIVSSKYRQYTCGFTKHLHGYKNHLEIPKYKLYGIDETLNVIDCMKIFCRLGSPIYGL